MRMQFSISMLFALTACTSTERSVCEHDVGRDAGGAVSGEIVEGRQLVPGSEVTIPHKVTVLIHSDVPVTELRVGGVPAQLTSLEQHRWEVLLGAADLESNRQLDKALLDVVVVDLCGLSHVIDRATVTLGPSPGASVSDLAMTEDHAPAGECYIPTDGLVRPLIRVSASESSLGATVTLRASHGTFANGSTEQELVLRHSAAASEASTFFVPDGPGFALLTASARGVDTKLLTVLAAAPPAFTAPAGGLMRDVGYNASVMTTGNLDRCELEELVTGTSVVKIVDPPLGVLMGIKSVRQAQMACDSPEIVRFEVRFLASAPEGSGAVIRCFDSYGRSSALTLVAAALTP